jgi:hypothetical protein
MTAGEGWGVSQQQVWTTRPDGGLVAEVGGLRLLVGAPAEDGSARFLVLRRRDRGDDADGLIGSGREVSVLAAMAAAEQMAEQFATPTARC